MRMIRDYLSELFRSTIDGWNRFWFKPEDPATLDHLKRQVDLLQKQLDALTKDKKD